MRRLVWAGLGAAAAVVAVRRLERVARRYTPAGVTEQVEVAGRRTEEAARGALSRFTEARARREAELVSTLLVTPEGGDPSAVLGRRRDRHRDTLAWEDDLEAETSHDAAGSRAGGRHARPGGRVDPDEPLYDF